MRCLEIALKPAALLLCLAAFLTQQQSSVEGTVLNRATGQPIAGVHVQLSLGISIQIPTLAYGAITDAEGRFSVSSMQPGYYTVDLKRTGFIQGIGKTIMRKTQIELRPGEHLTDWRLEMSPLVMIAGKVVNQNGDPVPNVQVRPIEWSQIGNIDNTWYTGFYHIKQTDERGQFRLFTPPGEYYLLAMPPPGIPTGPAEIRTDGTSVLTYNSTYYPDSPDADSAAIVEARPGNAVTGLEIRIRSDSPGNDLTLSGSISGIPAGAQAIIAYQYGTSPDHFQMGGSTGVAADGEFSIRNPHQGYVRLMAECLQGDWVLQSDPIELQLKPPGVDDVQIQLTRITNGAITGDIEIIGFGPGDERDARPIVDVTPLGMSMGHTPNPTRVDPDGTFRITGIPPGRYRLGVYNMPEDCYVQTIRLGDVESMDGTLDFSKGVPNQPLKITISRNGAQISGEVREADGGLAFNPNISVFLTPESGQGLEIRGAAINKGEYSIKGVPPGKYRIYAADIRKRSAAERANWPGGDPDLASAEFLEVQQGGRVIRNLQVIVPEEPDEHPSQ